MFTYDRKKAADWLIEQMGTPGRQCVVFEKAWDMVLEWDLEPDEYGDIELGDGRFEINKCGVVTGYVASYEEGLELEPDELYTLACEALAVTALVKTRTHG